jgi:hypothetical protein
MNNLATAILGTLAVSCIVFGPTSVNATAATWACNDPYGAEIQVGSGGGGSCLLESSTCVMGTRVDLWVHGGPSHVLAGENVGAC